jgi:hypothetical protein
MYFNNKKQGEIKKNYLIARIVCLLVSIGVQFPVFHDSGIWP